MTVLDTSFLIDYLDGVDATADYLTDEEAEPPFAATLSLFEVYRGALRSGGRERLERVESALDWVEPLALTAGAAREAALVETELRDMGAPVNLGDTLIAGICRHEDDRIVTRDDHFEQVAGLEVVRY